MEVWFGEDSMVGTVGGAIIGSDDGPSDTVGLASGYALVVRFGALGAFGLQHVFPKEQPMKKLKKLTSKLTMVVVRMSITVLVWAAWSPPSQIVPSVFGVFLSLHSSWQPPW